MLLREIDSRSEFIFPVICCLRLLTSSEFPRRDPRLFRYAWMVRSFSSISLRKSSSDETISSEGSEMLLSIPKDHLVSGALLAIGLRHRLEPRDHQLSDVSDVVSHPRQDDRSCPGRYLVRRFVRVRVRERVEALSRDPRGPVCRLRSAAYSPSRASCLAPRRSATAANAR